MKVETETKVISVTITMSQQEANWLKSVMQNPFCDDYDNEDDETRHMRERFFYALKGEPKDQPKPLFKPCSQCGDKYSLVHACKLRGDLNQVGFIDYEHWIECQNCGFKCAPLFRSDSTQPPPEFYAMWGAK